MTATHLIKTQPASCKCDPNEWVHEFLPVCDQYVPEHMTPCDNCNGNGWVEHPHSRPWHEMTADCEECNGTGEVPDAGFIDDYCGKCQHTEACHE